MTLPKIIALAILSTGGGAYLAFTSLLAFEHYQFTQCFDAKMSDAPLGKSDEDTKQFLFECYFPEMEGSPDEPER